MAEVVRSPRKQSLQIAGVAAATAVVLNGLFWVMSGRYFAGKPLEQAAELGSVRGAFAIMTFLIAVLSYAAAIAPRAVGHGLSIVIGVASIAGGIAGLVSTLPGVMGVTLLICGLIIPVLVIYSLKHSRSAWAFLIAMLSVLATVTFFGAPKIRHVIDISLWHALLIPGLMIVATIALGMLRDEYKGRA